MYTSGRLGMLGGGTKLGASRGHYDGSSCHDDAAGIQAFSPLVKAAHTLLGFRRNLSFTLQFIYIMVLLYEIQGLD